MRGTAWRQKFKKCGLFKEEVQAIAKAQRGQSRRLQSAKPDIEFNASNGRFGRGRASEPPLDVPER